MTPAVPIADERFQVIVILETCIALLSPVDIQLPDCPLSASDCSFAEYAAGVKKGEPLLSNLSC
jgi:hypothetical protein